MSTPASTRNSQRSIASRLTRLSLLEPTTREVGARPIRWSLLLVPLLVVGLIFAVREIARVERVLAGQGARAARVIVYELKPGSELRVPIEPGTDVFRIVAHAVRTKAQLAAEPHIAQLVVDAKGEQASTHDELTLPLPGTSARVKPEDSELSVGDPSAVNVDVHGVGVGVLTVTLRAIEGADGVLVRVYRRDALADDAIVKRTEHVTTATEEHLAKGVGEIEWSDIERPEQYAILGTRWRKVAALRDSVGLETHAIALSPAPASPAAAPRVDLGQVTDLRGDERVAWMVHGKNRVRAIAQGDVAALITATIRRADGTVTTTQAKGLLVVDVPENETLGVELGRSTPGPLAVDADDRAKVEPFTHAVAWRALPDRPVIVRAAERAFVLRVTARRPVARTLPTESTSELRLDATIALPGSTPETAMLKAQRPRSSFDRYDAKEPTEAPTTSAIFHVLVPPHATVTLTPEQSPLDLSIAELDPIAPPRTVTTYLASGAPPAVEEVGDLTWPGYVARRPSNLAAFEPDGRLLVRVAHRFESVPPPVTKAPTFRVKRPATTDAIVVDDMTFEPTSVRYEIDVPAGEPLVLPVRLYAKEKLEVLAHVDDDAPVRRTEGVAQRVTTARAMPLAAANDQTKSIVVLGDDLTPGTHVLSFSVPSGKEAWVHLPWLPKPRLPGTPPGDPHWIEGDLEE